MIEQVTSRCETTVCLVDKAILFDHEGETPTPLQSEDPEHRLEAPVSAVGRRGASDRWALRERSVYGRPRVEPLTHGVCL